ncbi:MAG TPA: OmpH family outer membrane protein [Flavobacteriaceae bacterium]|nr:OmpH family outer membrane protein [Flavobacteriaceae bacterium]
MRKFKTLLLIAVIAFGFNTAQAQDKIGHINVDQLISSMPEFKALENELEKLGKTYQAELKSESEKFQAKLKKYDAEAAAQTDEVNQRRQAEVSQDQQNLVALEKTAMDELNKKRNEKLKPIFEKAQNAINDVAKENGFTYIIDAKALVVGNGTDILNMVKAKLGIQ